MKKRVFLGALFALSVSVFARESYLDMKMNKVNKPIFVVVTANHCKYCENQKKVIENNPVLGNFIDQYFQYSVINMSRVPVPSELQPVRGTPTLYVVEKSGKVISRRSGFQSSKSLLNFLRNSLKKRYQEEIDSGEGVVVKGVPVQ